jgi:twitching motility protein PilJ
LAELIRTISSAARLQAKASDTLAKSMGDISAITKQTAQGTKQSVLTAGRLTELTSALRGSVSTFKLPSSNGASAA